MFTRSIVLASFFSLSLFAYDGYSYVVQSTGPGPSWYPGDMGVDGPSMCSDMELNSFNAAISLQACDFWDSYTRYFGDCTSETFSCTPVTSCPAGSTLNPSNIGNACAPDSCPSGQVLINSSVCGTPNTPLLNDPMNALNNDPAGCDAAGGYYFADGSCNGRNEMLQKIFSDPNAVIGAVLYVGGLAVSTLGFLGTPATGGLSLPAIGAGAYASAAGMLMIGLNNDLVLSTSQPSNDVTSGETRIKVSLKTVSGAGGGEASVLTKSNNNTGKVEQATYVPPATKSALSDPSYVNKIDGSLAKPIPLGGTQNTTYDYQNNIATTTTHEAVSTSANPITSTKTTTITVTQNTDGTITTNTTDPAVAPSVTGSGGGSVSSSSSSSTTGWGTGTGTTSGAGAGDTGTGPDYTGVLNDIKKNTGDSSGFLSDIKNLFNNSDSVDTSAATGLNADGHEGFGGYETNLKGSFAGFVFTDPLGLNGMGGAGIASYGFTILGHHYVILDQSMIDKLPLSLLRNLFLFLAALAGLITVVSGV